MKTKRWVKPAEIKEAIQEFELKDMILTETGLISCFIVEDSKGRQLNLCPKWEYTKLPEGTTKTDLKRGCRLIVRASKRKLKDYDNMIVFSQILQIKPPIQPGIEDSL